MLLLKFTLGLMIFPILLETLQTAVLDGLALAVVQLTSLQAFLIPTLFVFTHTLFFPFACRQI